MCRARPIPPRLRVRQYAARTTLCDARFTLRACKTVFRAHDPAGVRDSDAADSGVRDPIYRAHDLSGVHDLAPRNPTYPT